MILSDIGENLTLQNNGSNGDSVPATVPGSEVVRLTRIPTADHAPSRSFPPPPHSR
jgi:hypothetical protein